MGATQEVENPLITEVISIHAPVRGATFVPFLAKACKTDFNPRSREGSDKIKVAKYNVEGLIALKSWTHHSPSIISQGNPSNWVRVIV